jgi:hypothetical protein
MAIWYILWPFGIFSPVLVCCSKKNLATLVTTPALLKFYNAKSSLVRLEKTYYTFKNALAYCNAADVVKL